MSNATETGSKSRVRWGVVAGVVLGSVMVLLALSGGHEILTVPKAVLLGAVEGITEYLPVSSTGHLLVTQRLVDLGSGAGKTAADTYAIAIQMGAIAAVVALYWRRMVSMAEGLVGRDPAGRALLGHLLVAFAPAAVVGFALGDTVKDHLFTPWPVVIAWAVGGLFLLVWKAHPGTGSLASLTVRTSLLIGLAQTVALWPGVSRSLVTIAAALALGLSMGAAIEFSFLLGLATLTAATVLDLAKDGSKLLSDYGWRTPTLGALVAFVTAYVAVRWMVSYLRDHPLAIFGWYRIGIAIITIVLIVTGAV